MSSGMNRGFVLIKNQVYALFRDTQHQHRNCLLLSNSNVANENWNFARINFVVTNDLCHLFSEVNCLVKFEHFILSKQLQDVKNTLEIS